MTLSRSLHAILVALCLGMVGLPGAVTPQAQAQSSLTPELEAKRLWLDARKKMDRGNYNGAIRAFEQLFRLNDKVLIPDEHMFYYGIALKEAGRYQKALRFLSNFANIAEPNSRNSNRALELISEIQGKVDDKKAKDEEQRRKKELKDKIARVCGQPPRWSNGDRLRRVSELDRKLDKATRRSCVTNGDLRRIQRDWNRATVSLPTYIAACRRGNYAGECAVANKIARDGAAWKQKYNNAKKRKDKCERQKREARNLAKDLRPRVRRFEQCRANPDRFASQMRQKQQQRQAQQEADNRAKAAALEKQTRIAERTGYYLRLKNSCNVPMKVLVAFDNARTPNAKHFKRATWTIKAKHSYHMVLTGKGRIIAKGRHYYVHAHSPKDRNKVISGKTMVKHNGKHFPMLKVTPSPKQGTDGRKLETINIRC